MTRAKWLPTAAQMRAHDEAVRRERMAYRAETWRDIQRGQRIHADGVSVFMDYSQPWKPPKKPGFWQKLRELFR